MEAFPKKLAGKLSERASTNSLRFLKGPGNLIDFFSNDYLGLAGNQSIYSWAGQLVCDRDMVRNGATGSRLLSGNYSLYQQLEELLQQIHGAPCLVFNSGYDANLGFFSSVPQRGDLVLFDELVHASIRDGIRMGLAQGRKFKHNDLTDLEIQWTRGTSSGKFSEVYVVSESVFSMDGDTPDLNGLAAFCRERGCRLVVDEAHAVGVFNARGTGLMQEMGLESAAFARILTFGKAMGGHGAAIAGSLELKNYLTNFARSFIYTTALPPHSVATLLASHYFLVTNSGEQLQKALRDNIEVFNTQLDLLELRPYFAKSISAIHCCLIPGNNAVKAAADYLQGLGFDVRPILAPTVPEGLERLRFCLHGFNSKSDIREVLEKLANHLGTV